jgi:hypothetical protein
VEGLKVNEYEAWKRDPTTKKVIAVLLKLQTEIMESWANGKFVYEEYDAFNRGRLRALFEFINIKTVDGG